MVPQTSLRTAALALALLALPVVASSASAQTIPQTAWNPKPASGDIVLPMPLDIGMVFVRVPVPGTGHWGAGERIFDFGFYAPNTSDITKNPPFEVPRQARIGGSFRTGDKWYNVFGKYEVSVAQYAVIAGDGDLKRGLELLAERSAEPEYKATVRPDIAANVLNATLSKPVTGLSVPDYEAFIDAYNDWCIKSAACLKVIQDNFQALGFLRLPTEVEWEFVARGGEAKLRSPEEFRDTLPFSPADVAKYARIDAIRSGRLAPIGSRDPLFGLYDVFGNVMELMAGPFAMDQFYSRIGGRVARGGSFVLRPSEIRTARRDEIELFTKREDGSVLRARPTTLGIRLVVGSHVSDRRDLADIQREFRESYIPIGGGAGGERVCGKTPETARDMGVLDGGRATSVVLKDLIGADQPQCYFTFRTNQFGKLQLAGTSGAGDIAMQAKLGTLTRDETLRVGRPATITFDSQPPGTVLVKFEIPATVSAANFTTNVTFSVIDAAGDRLATAADLGTLPSDRTIERKDYVGGADLADVWKFTLPTADTVALQLDDLSGNLDLELRDASDRVLKSSRQGGSNPERIESDRLEPGSYFIRIIPGEANAGSTYTLRVAKGAIDTAGQSCETARDLGTLGEGEQRILEHVGGSDPADYFKFTPSDQMRMQVSVGNFTSDVDLELFNASCRSIANSRKPGLERESIDRVVEPRQAHYLAVTGSGAKTPYSMSIIMVKVAPFSVRENAAVATIPASLSPTLDSTPRREYWVRFALASSTGVSIELKWNDTAADLDLQLLDEAGREIAKSDGTTTNEKIERSLNAGTYYAKVFRDSGPSTATPFTLTLREGARVASFATGAATCLIGAELRNSVPASSNDYFCRFTVSTRGTVTLALNWDVRNTDLDLFLYDNNGTELQKSDNATGTTERIERTLDAGTYVFKIHRDSGPNPARATPFRVALGGSAGGGRVDPPAGGGGGGGRTEEPVVRSRHNDWEVLTKVESGKTWCMARTYATGSTPDGWRRDRPFMLFQVTNGDRTTRFQFDTVSPWQSGGAFTGRVSGGTSLTIPVLVEGGWLKSLQPCIGSSGMCVSNNGLRGLTKGTTLDISGRTSEGRPGRVTYSLRGYTAAINAMNALCDNTSATGWLIK